ncbi:alpha/beta fold hydrolase BchO [Aureimonas leprariae]|uniref:Alpha/beta fold hydrolase n=1 Tax=Plantimonas leprariae TaxID=2615207 RepID=A0A7V7PQ81_9HYPH|nr:alpha/beta fold hydrolase BchO [Aureimonas leprariae]KAB0680313.1 alpha/beta fold hydrolase [Aureimonas leprariae]
MFGGLRSPSWSVEGRDWPNRAFSRFVRSGGLLWHLQEMGEGPRVLFVHGTGAATHSFRDLAPLLAASGFRVLALDLPGHGFTQHPASGDGLSLPGMARLVRGVLAEAGFEPQVAVGHSAGAAVLVAMALDGSIRPETVVALNGALLPIRGAALFSPLAKLLFLNPLAPRLFALRAISRDATRRLLESTGSAVDARGVELYARLFRSSGHVAATLGMMANWDLDPIERRLPALAMPLVLVAAADDRAIPPADARTVAARMPNARVVPIRRGGHLVHESEPAEIAALIRRAAAEAGVVPAGPG